MSVPPNATGNLPKLYVFSSYSSAKACSDHVDSIIGYPIDGIEIGDGWHCRMTTTTYYVPMPHPTKSEWAYVSDGVTNGLLASAGLTAGMTPVAQDNTWIPVP